LAGEGNPVVAWLETPTNDNFQIYLRRWNGTAWAELAGSASGNGVSNGGGYAMSQALALDNAGNPVVAWSDRSEPNNMFSRYVYLRRFNGSAWVELGGSASGGGISSNIFGSWTAGQSLAVAVNGAGNPIVAWTHRDDATVVWGVYVRRWTGSTWEELAGSGSGGGIGVYSLSGLGTRGMDMVLDSAGNPWVVWQVYDTTLGWRVHLRRWNGLAWVEVGGSATGNGVSTGVVHSKNPTLALDGDDQPVVAWVVGASVTNWHIYLRRWNGAAWVEVGGSASGGGISKSTALVARPGLAIDASDNPVVAWEDLATGIWQIYLRRWTGTEWVELDGSATGGGLSQEPMTCAISSLALDGIGNPVVAWSHNPIQGGAEIYLRRWMALGLENLSQHAGSGPAVLGLGASVEAGTMRFRGRTWGGSPGALTQMQIEVRPVSQFFTGLPTASSPFTAAGEWKDVQLFNLASGAWHWQARAVDSEGVASPWRTYGGNTDGWPDFVVQLPATVIPGGEAHSDGHRGCGMLGPEAMIILLLLQLLRRSRTPRRGSSGGPHSAHFPPS
jgi:hypothetical protein